MWANMYLQVRSMSQCLLLPFRCGMWWFIFFSFFLSVGFPAVLWLIGLVQAEVQECIREPSITLCSIPWQLMSHGPASSVLYETWLQKQRGWWCCLGVTTGSFLFLQGLFRWHLWDPGDVLALGRRQQHGLGDTFTSRVCNQRVEHLESSSEQRGLMAPTHSCGGALAAWEQAVEAGVQKDSFDGRRWFYFCVGGSGWTDTSGCGWVWKWWQQPGLICCWQCDWNINADVFHKVNT